jgi:hypothetical protein
MLEGMCFSPVHTDTRGWETILVVPRAETCSDTQSHNLYHTVQHFSIYIFTIFKV